MELELEKNVPIITSIISTGYAILVSVYLNYHNRKKDKMLSIDEINFILSRADQNAPLNKQLPIHEESKLIEKSYGFYATREQFNQLSEKIEMSYDIRKIKRIKKFLELDENTPAIKFESVDKLIVWASRSFIVLTSILAAWKAWKLIKTDWFAVIILIPFLVGLGINHFFLEPYRQAKKVKDILEKGNES